MAITERGDAVDPLKFLTMNQANQLKSRRFLDVPAEGCPRPCHKVRLEHADQIMDRLLTAGPSTILPEDSIPMVPFKKSEFLSGSSARAATGGVSRRRLLGGLYGIAKSPPKTACYIRQTPSKCM